jgi:hypothetical protein
MPPKNGPHASLREQAAHASRGYALEFSGKSRAISEGRSLRLEAWNDGEASHQRVAGTVQAQGHPVRAVRGQQQVKVSAICYQHPSTRRGGAVKRGDP